MKVYAFAVRTEEDLEQRPMSNRLNATYENKIGVLSPRRGVAPNVFDTTHTYSFTKKEVGGKDWYPFLAFVNDPALSEQSVREMLPKLFEEKLSLTLLEATNFVEQSYSISQNIDDLYFDPSDFFQLISAQQLYSTTGRNLRKCFRMSLTSNDFALKEKGNPFYKEIKEEVDRIRSID